MVPYKVPESADGVPEGIDADKIPEGVGVDKISEGVEREPEGAENVPECVGADLLAIRARYSLRWSWV